MMAMCVADITKIPEQHLYSKNQRKTRPKRTKLDFLDAIAENLDRFTIKKSEKIDFKVG